jgi:hypothetical protein
MQVKLLTDKYYPALVWRTIKAGAIVPVVPASNGKYWIVTAELKELPHSVFVEVGEFEEVT